GPRCLFFFQAEDGIRDKLVTGVQTCALPIWTRTGVAVLALALGHASLAAAVVTGQIFGPGSESFPIAIVPLKNLGGDPGGELGRSEERRVGKSVELGGRCRSRRRT